MVMMHVGINVMGKYSCDVLEAKCRLLHRVLKARASKVAFSDMLPVPPTRPAKQCSFEVLVGG